jgi:deoxyribonuclease V|tara:strand:- start:1664 stop:2317 length:654 start_codon:yes stop_codon:yes gene_type:complete
MNPEELIEKYGIDIEKLENEQIKLAKQLEIKDKIDFSLADRFGAIDISFVGNKILASIIICDKDLEVIDRAYVLDKVRFPYLAGFRSYRELPVMVDALNKLKEKPDVIFLSAQGITHPRLGLASHFSLSTGIPVIGVANSVIDSEVKGEDILRNGEKVGKIFLSKPGSRPMYVSPGNEVSIDTSLELCKQFINLPHKLPEPMHLAGKYGREVKKELN